MVRRRIPLHRRIQANFGRIVGMGVWAFAALLCVVLYPMRSTPNSGIAVAVVRQLPIVAPESGRIASLSVDADQPVTAGSVVAVIEVPGLPQLVAASEAEVRALEQELAVAGVERDRKFEGDVEAARTNWLTAKVNLESQRATLAGVEIDLARMVAPGVELPETQIAGKRTERDALQAAVTAREDQVAAMERTFSAAQARAGGAEAATLRARLDAAQAQLAAMEARQESCTLRAHASGTISPDLPAVGGWAQAGVPLLTITENSTQQAIVYVNSNIARGMEAGTVVALRGPAGEPIQAEVDAIGAAVQVVPIRQQRDPAVPEWGIPVTLRVLDKALMPGEALAVEF